MSWTDQPVLALDCESTGVDTRHDRIVEIAAALIHPNGHTGDTWHRIVDPGIPIPDEAAAIHGITTERAQAEGVDPTVMLEELATILDHNRRLPVVAYNASYDLPLILTEACRHRIDLPTPAWVLDPLVIDKACDTYRKGSRKLIDTAALHGVTLDADQAHGALADCIAAGQLMHALAVKHPNEVGDRTLTQLWLRQMAWAEAQRASFVAYRARNGNPIDKPAGWPIPIPA